MSTSTLTIQLPGPIYERLEARARQTNRSVEAEALDVLASSIDETGGLPPEIAQAIGMLSNLDDEALWQTARTGFDSDAGKRIAELHLWKQDRGLLDSESAELRSLMRQYERAMVIRARAIQILHDRGHDVSSLNQP